VGSIRSPTAEGLFLSSAAQGCFGRAALGSICEASRAEAHGH
jgi:hypothetical protein